MTYRGRHYWGANPLIDNCYPYRRSYCNWRDPYCRTPYYGGYYGGYYGYGGYGGYDGYGGYNGYRDW